METETKKTPRGAAASILAAAALWGIIGVWNRRLMAGGLSPYSIVVVRNCGGLVLLTVYTAERRTHHTLWRRCLRSAGIITAYEFVVGCLVNLRLGWQVWDYSSQPGNVLGQVCPLFCFLWLMLSLPVLLLCGWLRHHMEPQLPRRSGLCWR